MRKFPKTLHVTLDKYVNDPEPSLTIHEDGIDDSEFTETKAVAVYRLVEVGKVVVERRYIGKQGRR
jgi:hypothetical protein